MYPHYMEHAELHEEIDVSSSDDPLLFVAVAEGASAWPSLVVTQRFAPGPDFGFTPGVCLVPAAHLLLIGAGTRLLAYDLRSHSRLWEDAADFGFWGWRRHKDVILMSAELELAAWDVQGKKLWSTFVEPPWSYTVAGGNVTLDVMGQMSVFPIETGPEGMEGR